MEFERLYCLNYFCAGRVSVSFLHGADGNPWTWVMGEHPDDKSLDEILEAEAHSTADTLAKRKALEAHSYLLMHFHSKFSFSCKLL